MKTFEASILKLSHITLLMLPNYLERLVQNIAGVAVSMKDWLRITFAIDPSALEDGLERMKAFCKRHAKKEQTFA